MSTENRRKCNKDKVSTNLEGDFYMDTTTLEKKLYRGHWCGHILYLRNYIKYRLMANQ